MISTAAWTQPPLDDTDRNLRGFGAPNESDVEFIAPPSLGERVLAQLGRLVSSLPTKRGKSQVLSTEPQTCPPKREPF